MNTRKSAASIIVLLLALNFGCMTTENVERGPQGTRAYYVEVEASEPGVRIEADGNDVGLAPCTLKIYADKDGTFHNFGSYDYVVKAYPTNANLSVKTKVFRTGGWWTPEDRVPNRIYFDMTDRSDSFSVDLPQQNRTQ